MIDLCHATISGGIDIRTATDQNSILNESLFLSDNANFFGAGYRSGSGICYFLTVNFTSTRASECVGCFETKDGLVSIKHSVVVKSSALCHNGAICLRGASSLEIEDSAFIQCGHNTTEKQTASVLLIYDNPYESTIKNCVFAQNNPSGSHTVNVPSGYVILISNSCFSGSQSIELEGRYTLAEGNRFEQRRCGLNGSRTIQGYGNHIKRPIATMATTTRLLRGRLGRREKLAVSWVVGIIVSGAVSGLRIVRWRATKTPMALV
jgi:hypothetical protein